MRTGIETGSHLESTRKQAMRLEKADQAGVRSRQNCATGVLDRSHWAIRSAQIWAVFDDGKRDISRISMRTGIETRAHLESTRKQAMR